MLEFPQSLKLPEFVRRDIEEVLVQAGYTDRVSEETALGAIAIIYNLPRVPPSSLRRDMTLVKLYDSDLMSECPFIPLLDDGTYLHVALTNPRNDIIHDTIAHVHPNRTPLFYIASPQQILSALRTLDGQSVYKSFEEDDGKQILRLRPDEQSPFGEMSKVLIDCLALGVSDLHIQMGTHQVLIRRELGGRLETIRTYDIASGRDVAMVFLSKTNIRQEDLRRRCDGNLSIEHAGHRVDLRIACLPTYSPLGSAAFHASIRLQDASRIASYQLKDLFIEEDLRRILRAIESPGSLCIIAGPTGSGKTTTLGAALRHVNTPDRMVYAIEDPTENIIPGVSCISVGHGLTFADAIKGLLRMKPHVIMVGEMREKETAKAVIEAASTGHTVLTTIHCDQAADIPERLAQVGIPSHEIASKLRLCSSQRLLPRLCGHCSVPHKIARQQQIIHCIPDYVAAGLRRRNPKGCAHCNYSGIAGRRPIIEIVDFTDDLTHKLYSEDRGWVSFKLSANKQLGERSLRQQALSLLAVGATDMEDILKCMSLATNDKQELPLLDEATVLPVEEFVNHTESA